MEQQHRRNGQSRPQQRRPAQQHSSRSVQGAHFAEPSAKRTARHGAPQHTPQHSAPQHIPQHAAQHSAPQHPPQHAAQHSTKQRPPQRNQAQQRTRRPAEGQQRPQQNRQQRPVQRRPAGRNIAPQRPQQRQRPAGYGTRSAAARHPQQVRSRTATGSNLMFIAFLILYIILGIIIIRLVSKKASGYMTEYEASRPQYKIAEYTENLGNDFYHDMLVQAAEKLEISEYESASRLLKTMEIDDSDISGSQQYTYKKCENFSESHPSYYILRDKKAIASIDIERSGWTAKYSFPEWRVCEPVSLMEVNAKPVYSLSVTMPKGAKLTINGKRVPDDAYRPTDAELILTKTEQNFMKQPQAVKCELEGLYAPPVVTVTDGDGKTMEPEITPEPNEAEQVYLFTKHDAAVPDENVIQRAEDLTKAYIDYVINKDADRYSLGCDFDIISRTIQKINT